MKGFFCILDCASVRWSMINTKLWSINILYQRTLHKILGHNFVVWPIQEPFNFALMFHVYFWIQHFSSSFSNDLTYSMSFYVTLTFLNHCLNLSRCILDKRFVCSKNTTTHGSKCSKREHFTLFVVGKPSGKISSSIQKPFANFMLRHKHKESYSGGN